MTTRRNLIGRLGDALQAYQRSTQSFDDEVGRHLAVNPVDLRCLDWLVDRPRTARELSEAVGLSSAATTAMVDRLERRGFVRRTRNDADRRQVIVEMTDEGRDAAGRFYGPLVADGMAILGRLTLADMTLMLGYLDEIRELTDRHRDRLRRERTSSRR